MSYESPIEVFEETISSQYNKTLEEAVWKEVTRIGVSVDKHELIRALRYDRGQYERGYNDGLNANKWIPTSERYPDEPGTYLVTENTWTLRICNFCYSDRTHKPCWYYGWEKYTLPDAFVIAWMPLPEPYEGER